MASTGRLQLKKRINLNKFYYLCQNESAGEKKGKTFYDSTVFQFLYPLESPFNLSVWLTLLGCAERESREFDQGNYATALNFSISPI